MIMNSQNKKAWRSHKGEKNNEKVEQSLGVVFTNKKRGKAKSYK